ncbi:MAG: O-antigen ligase family protein [Terriglobales bacterium]
MSAAGQAVRAARAPARGLGGWLWGLAAMAVLAPTLVVLAEQPPHAALWIAAGWLAVGSLAAMVLRPDWGALLLILIVYWNASDVLTENLGVSWLLRALLIWLVGCWLLSRLLAPRAPRLRWPLLAPLALYGAVLAVSGRLGSNWAYSWADLKQYGKALVIFFLLVNLLRTPRRVRWGIYALLAAVVLMALPVIYQGLTGSSFTFWGFGGAQYESVAPHQMGWRLAGSMGDPNFFALALAATLPLAAILFLDARQAWERAFAAAAAGAALLATAFSYSRASVFGIGFIFLALVIGHRRRAWVVAAAVGGMAGLLLLMPPTFRARMLSLRQLSLTAPQQSIASYSFRGRRSELLAGLAMWRAHPWLGVGAGAYSSAYERYAAWVELDPRGEQRDPHNLFLQVAAETGIVGLAAFLWLLLCAWRMLRRARDRLRRAGAGQLANLTWGLELGLETYLLLSVFLHGAYFRHFFILLALAAAMAAAMAAAVAAMPVPGPALPGARAAEGGTGAA